MKLTDRSAEPVTALDSSKSRAKNQTGKNELQAFTKTPAQEDQISWH